MADQDNRNGLEKVLGFITSTGIPLAQAMVYGGYQASPAELAAETNYYDRLNGSGAPDRAAFERAAGRSEYDRLFGGPDTAKGANPSPFGVDVKQLITLLGIGLIVALIMKKF